MTDPADLSDLREKLTPEGDWRRDPTAIRHQRAIDAIDRVLGAVEQGRVSPELWECYCLYLAISALRQGHYNHSLVEALLALEPAGNRSKAPVKWENQCTVAELKVQFEQVRGLPMRERDA